MDFFDRQARARKQTWVLLCLFPLATLVVATVLYLAVATFIWVFQHPLVPAERWHPLLLVAQMVFFLGNALFSPLQALNSLWNLQQFCLVGLFTLLCVALGCSYKIRLLSGGGKAVAELLRGRRVKPGTSDPDERRLRDVVEEMAVASGMPVPEIYVLDRERGINSFAAGHTHEDVVIGVTFGCLKLLTRDELQGVIAHEFSHVLNGDTRLNMRLMGLAHGLVWPTIVGRVLFYGTDYIPAGGGPIFDDDNSSPVQWIFFPIAIPLLIVGRITTPFVRWIKSAVCREREKLADAAAIQFTRNPPGIEGALKKTGGLLKQGRLDTPYAETASHLYFVNSVPDPWFSFQSTHPPLLKRILAINPAFDGQFQHVKSLPSRDAEYDRIYEESVRRARAKAQRKGSSAE